MKDNFKKLKAYALHNFDREMINYIILLRNNEYKLNRNHIRGN